MALIWRMNRAILTSHITGLEDVQVDTKNFPIVFDESLLRAFGGLSVADFVAGGFLPYIFLTVSELMAVTASVESSHIHTSKLPTHIPKYSTCSSFKDWWSSRRRLTYGTSWS